MTLDDICAAHPTRVTEKEKEDFRREILSYAEQQGYHAQVEENGFLKHRNVVIGDPEHAAVLFVAPQETDSRGLLPRRTYLNHIPVFILQQLLSVLLLMIPCLMVAVLVTSLTHSAQLGLALVLLCYLGLLFLERFGPARKENRAATSAPYTLLALMERIPADARKKVAFLFPDASYHGRGGAKAYAAAHESVSYTRLTVNLDVPILGESVILVARPLAEKCTGYRALIRSLSEHLPLVQLPNRFTVMQTDQKFFRCGVEITSATQKPGMGYVQSFGQGPCSEERLGALIDALCAFVCSLTGTEAVQEK